MKNEIQVDPQNELSSNFQKPQFVQTGDKNTQIGHAEHLTLNIVNKNHFHVSNKHKISKKILLPYVENENFIGRLVFLKDIKAAFSANSEKPTTVNITGLAGIGKTQLALKYVYQNIKLYDTVCWLECSTEETINKTFVEFLALISEPSDEKIHFTNWFHNNSNWLIVFNDVNENTSIEQLIPKYKNGHIIKTTQINEKSKLDGAVIPLEELSKDEAVDFLTRRTNSNDIENASKISYRLGYFPLALEQAAAYICETDIDLSKYYELLNNYDLEVFDDNESVKNYKWNIKTVWGITLQKLSENARQMLYCFAYMASDNIVLDLLTNHAKELHDEYNKPDKFIEKKDKFGNSTNEKFNISEFFKKYITTVFPKELIELMANELKVNNTLKELKKFSIVSIRKDKRLTIHGLLQEIIRSTINDSTYLLVVAEIVGKEFNELGLIYDDYHIAFQMNQAKSIIVNIETLLMYKKEYEESKNSPSLIYMWELQFHFYSFMARYLTIYGIYEKDNNLLEEADECYKTACEVGEPLYGGGGDSHLSSAHTFTIIQEKHRRMFVNLKLGRIDIAEKLYQEIRKPVSAVINSERHMSFNAFNNCGDLWKKFRYFTLAKDAYTLAAQCVGNNEINVKIAECENNF
ncbi:NB-ARC domain-containing protein [Clostridium estertheticum]|uniref:NB-ARC domain-containing protein n=1 Tax=Clostridium estertheticum TaxID=238834 RepID=A0A7Y3SW11_9CLOT|nr:NB-ARC domain-containing protein [Clostridium estertheticum]NNU76341.1 hypothetical protein [Clostridium estertheticum]WBL45836.1 hypothetical protein LOR37_14210 [Clostridium estertheticum]